MRHAPARLESAPPHRDVLVARALDAAETLCLAGAWDEASLELARGARLLAERVFGVPEPADDAADRLVALGVPASRARAFVAGLREPARPTPRSIRSRLADASAVERAVLAAGRPGFERRLRKGAAVVSFAAIAIVLGLVARERASSMSATASGAFGDAAAFAPERAVDGDPTTEWLAPLGPGSWLEIAMPHAVDLAAVELVNARHAPYEDRGVRDVRIVAFAGGRVVGTASAHLERGGHPGDRARVVLAAHGVDRVRVEVLSSWDRGAGLAEVTFERPPGR